MYARIIACFYGVAALLNLAAGLSQRSAFDFNQWWIDFSPLPTIAGRLIMFLSGILFIAWAARPVPCLWRRRATLALLGVLSIFVIANIVTYYFLLIDGQIHAGIPVPFSLLVAGMLAVLLRALWRAEPNSSVSESPLRLAAFGLAMLIGLPLTQMFLYGRTDYRRRADAIVVFGARTYADGNCSTALADRVRTACELYQSGLADTLIMSGGPGDGAIHETEAMRRLAMKLGVPNRAIILDTHGNNTQSTVKNTNEILSRLSATRLMAVSHSYHLPRVKLCYQSSGRMVYTVPANESQLLTKMPLLMMREVAAIWAYYFDALTA